MGNMHDLDASYAGSGNRSPNPTSLEECTDAIQRAKSSDIVCSVKQLLETQDILERDL